MSDEWHGTDIDDYALAERNGWDARPALDAALATAHDTIERLADGMAAATARAERAEAAEADLRATVQRVRAIAVQLQQTTGWRISEVVGAELLAVLDAQRPAEGGPEGEVVGFHRVQTPAGERVVYHPAGEEPAAPAALDGGQPEPVNENGIPLSQIKVGARVRLIGLKGETDATVVRMDSPT
jgi:hypothetical protein